MCQVTQLFQVGRHGQLSNKNPMHRCVGFAETRHGSHFQPGMTLGVIPHWIDMTFARDVLTVVPTLVLSAVAVLGIAVLIGLSAWDLPIGFDD